MNPTTGVGFQFDICIFEVEFPPKRKFRRILSHQPVIILKMNFLFEISFSERSLTCGNEKIYGGISSFLDLADFKFPLFDLSRSIYNSISHSLKVKAA